MIIQQLHRAGLIKPPSWLPDNCHFLAYTGSVAYACSADTSDMDVHGFCIPPKDVIFPFSNHSRNIIGFGEQPDRFRSWQEHHIRSLDGNKDYDFNIYNIVDFVDLASKCNPNVLELLFMPRRCILHSTQVYEYLRTHRHAFLHQGAMQKLRAYAFSQLTKIRNKNSSKNPKRAESIATHGFDLKFAYSLVRLTLQAEQIMLEGDLDLEKNSEILKSVRRGEWTLEAIEKWFEVKERVLEGLVGNSPLKAEADMDFIKNLLIDCLQMHFGDLSSVVSKSSVNGLLIRDLKALLAKYE